MKKISGIIISLMLCIFAIASFIFINDKSMTNADANIPDGKYQDTVVDTISVSDLYFDNKANQEIIMENKNTDATFNFSNENINKNLVFKFKYDVVDDNTSDSNAFRVHFDVANDKWNADNSLWVRGDGTYIKYQKDDKSFDWKKYPALNLGMHNIEFGRIAILDNNVNTNKYYVYYKLDNVLISEFINEYDLSLMDGNMFINISAGNTQNKIYDTRHIDGPYEIPDRISINNLKINNSSFGNNYTLSKHQTFTYESTATNKSVVLDFIYKCNDTSSVDCQFHFNNTWLGDNHGGIIWVRDDKNRISKAGGGYLETNPFNALGLYKIRLSKLYINSGENVGKYYLSLEINNVKKLEYIISDMPNNSALFTTGTNNDVIYDINYMPINLDNDLYVASWDTYQSGIKFVGTLNKEFVDISNVNEVGFIINDDYKNKIRCILKEDGNNYVAHAAISSIDIDNITKKYKATLYYVMPNDSGINKTYYSDSIKSSFYEVLDNQDNLSAQEIEILNNIKSNVLNITIDEDNFDVVGASINGTINDNVITLTGNNDNYHSYVINNKIINDNDEIKIGYLNYKININNNIVTLTKQNKKMIYGGSEHFVELNSGHDTKMTANNLAPMANELNLSTIRLDIDFKDLFDITPNNDLIIKYSHVNKIQNVINTLKNNSNVNDFLGVIWTILPYGYKNWDGKPWQGKVAPNPNTEQDAYVSWLNLNKKAAKIASSLLPDINYFETWNEAEIMSESDGPLAKSDGTNYSVNEKAIILTDLMYYLNEGLKETNIDNMLTTPSLCCAQKTDNEFDVTSPNFLKALYQNINDNIPVTGYSTVDKNPNNYFQIINLHPYLSRNTTTSNWKNFIKSFYDIAVSYNDSGTELWITEFGFAQNRESNCISKMQTILGQANEIEYLTRFYFYKIHDYTDKIDQDRWGLYDYDGNIKEIGTVVKNYINAN